MIELDGTLRENVSIMNPVITIEYVPDDEADDGGFTGPSQFNYFYIPQFERFYFVTDVVVISDRLLQISGHVDVLESFKTDYMFTDAIIARASSSNAYNKKINDGSAVLYQDTKTIIKRSGTLKQFSYDYSKMSGTGYVLAVAGGIELIPPE